MSASAQTRGPSSRRSALVNAVAATAFLTGGSLFALGAALAQAGVNPTACASIYLAGGAFFSSGGYASVLQVVNERARRIWRRCAGAGGRASQAACSG